MKDVAHTRNFALVGHSGDGKTALAVALLEAAGVSADCRKAFDSSPEEQERGHTLACTVYSFAAGDLHYTLVDTPGDSNFQGAGQIALHALDAAILVVSAAEGVKVGSERMWRAAQEAGIPTLVFINGCDAERADFAAALESLKALSEKSVPVMLPQGSGAEFAGVIDLVMMRGFDNAGKPCDLPADMQKQAEAARAELVEAVAECDDALLETYLEQGALDDEAFRQGLRAAFQKRALLPVLCGSQAGPAGGAALLEALGLLMPAPTERAVPFAAADGAEIAADPEAGFSARVFKTGIDRYAGKLSYLRVVSGGISENAQALNLGNNEKVRIGKLLQMQGSAHVDVHEAGPGDVIAVSKLQNVHTGDSLGAGKEGPAPQPIPIPQGVLSYAISAKEKADEDKLFSNLAKLVEEDPTLSVQRDPGTGEFLLSGMGELHIRLSAQKLKRLYDVEAELHTPKVPYRETLTRKVENVEGKLKKQSGGKGMFGVCYLTLEPLPRGAGVEFSDEITGGAIPRNLIPAVEKGCVEAAQSGPLGGFPVVDVRVRCIDGKHHSVDSNEMAFKLAGSFGFKEAMAKGAPTLLEPVMNAEITVPDENLGDVMGDLAGRRGRVQGTEARGAMQVVRAEVPLAEMLEYAGALTSMTGGKGAFHIEFAHYAEAPASEREKLATAAAGKDAEGKKA